MHTNEHPHLMNITTTLTVSSWRVIAESENIASTTPLSMTANPANAPIISTFDRSIKSWLAYLALSQKLPVEVDHIPRNREHHHHQQGTTYLA